MADTTDVPARTPDLGISHRTSKVAHAIIPRDVTAGGMTLSIGVQILEPTVLDSYARRRMISARQYEAGCILAKLFNRAIHLPSVTASYGERRGGGGGSDTGIDARKILWQALIDADLGFRMQTEQAFVVHRRESVERENVAGPIALNDLGNLVVSVCGYDDRAGGTVRIIALRAALDRLAALWDIPEADSPPHEGRIRKSRSEKSIDDPSSRDLSWSDKQNQRRADSRAKREATAEAETKKPRKPSHN